MLPSLPKKHCGKKKCWCLGKKKVVHELNVTSLHTFQAVGTKGLVTNASYGFSLTVTDFLLPDLSS